MHLLTFHSTCAVDGLQVSLRLPVSQLPLRTHLGGVLSLRRCSLGFQFCESACPVVVEYQVLE